MWEGELPRWWRPFWGALSLGSLMVVVELDYYAAVLPMLVAYAAACFGMEYLVRHQA